MPLGSGVNASPAAPDLAPASVGSAHGAAGAPPKSAPTPVRTAVRRRQRSSARRTSGLGLGLTHVPPVADADPRDAVLANPEVPEEKRSCPSCGAAVGRDKGVGTGRTEGFCPQCRAPYSFAPKLREGDLVAGQYEVAGALAHGGLGWIYLARDRNVSGRWVVLKGLLNTGDADALTAAIAEQEALAQVEHPLIVEIYNVVRHEGAAYTVMEYVGGTSLKQLLKDRMAARGVYDPLPVDQALAYVIEILPAFTYLHDVGLLYCDFKPDNLIHSGDTVKLIDLGGVRRTDDHDSPIYGTVGYQAPEVAEVGPSIASDIYTIGRTLAVLAFEFRGYQTEYVDRLPSTSQVDVLARHDSFDLLLRKACAASPDDRFLTVDELRAQMIGVLRQVVTGSTGSAATQSAHSVHFEPPVITTDSLSWWDLPSLRPDDRDPMVDWVSSLRSAPAIERFAMLGDAPERTAEVHLAQARAALAANRPDLVTESVEALLADDPWDWRAAWMLGLDALARQDWPEAISAFTTVRGQVPGEVSPLLALGLAYEKAGDSGRAIVAYTAALRADAGFVTPAAFGISRLRLASKDRSGAIEALDAVPITSPARSRARMARAELLARSTSYADLDQAIRTFRELPVDAREQESFGIGVFERALDRVLAGNAAPNAQLEGVVIVEDSLRRELEKRYRRLASLTPDAGTRVSLVDRANALRPWSLL